jgi:hypothetical protein
MSSVPHILTKAEKYKATKADTAENEKKANLTLRNGLSISSLRRCLVVNPPNFSPRSASSIGAENNGVALTFVRYTAEAGAANACAAGTADATDSMKRRRFIVNVEYENESELMTRDDDEILPKRINYNLSFIRKISMSIFQINIVFKGNM